VIEQLPRAKLIQEPLVEGMKRSREQGLPVFVVEDHWEVLQYVHKSIKQKRLPWSGFTMVHFDSHPDLMVTPTMAAEKV
jgi:hypothetical protein